MPIVQNRVARYLHFRSLDCLRAFEDEPPLCHASKRPTISPRDFTWEHFTAAINALDEVVTKRRELAETFRRLVDEWKSRRAHSSCIEDMVLDLSYQQIIGLGPQAIPLLLSELEKAPDHWFWALYAIARHDPVPDASRGKVTEMAKAWIDWGRQQGYGR
ncbi:MAG: hypothetical protein ACT4QC_22715 [Planctomycetaceae bacterium]